MGGNAEHLDTSLLLARLIGPLFAVVGVGVLLNQTHYAKMAESFLKDTELYYFSGAIAFVVGIAIILHHNLWVADWRVVFTVIGWMSLFKGVARIVLPTMGSKVVSAFVASRWMVAGGGLIVLIIGAWLSYVGSEPEGQVACSECFALKHTSRSGLPLPLNHVEKNSDHPGLRCSNLGVLRRANRVALALDVFIVALLIEKNFDMFRSVLGVWIPQALIFTATYLTGNRARRRPLPG